MHFAFTAFTRRTKSQSDSELRVKARGVSSFTSFTSFTFIDNTFIFNSLSLLVKAVKAKNTTYM
ncbi:MAG: hypothetical protein D8B56_05855 [Alloprevotella sp.]|nr:MAG: hypothetical protein D8B56_05855 [Alloprevotella sp.]